MWTSFQEKHLLGKISPLHICQTAENWQEIILIDMHFIYLFFFLQLNYIQTTVSPLKINKYNIALRYSVVVQTDQTELLDLLISKVKGEGDGSQGLSMQKESDEEIGLQVFQTKPLDLSIPKLKEEGNKSQSLSMEGVSYEGIKPQRQPVPIETLMDVMELSKQKESTGKKQCCDICQKNVANMKKHTMTHSGEKTYSCPVCKANFARFWDMEKHMMTHIGEKTYSCPVCKTNFVRFWDMKKHMMTHIGEKTYSCPVCKKNFVRFWDMKKHVMTHIGKQPYSCPVCKKNLFRFWDMKKHIMTHITEKTYSCPVCKRNFAHFWNMKKHTMAHIGIQLSDMQKNFVRFWDMKKHMMTHIGGKTYSCPICKRNFVHFWDMKKHMMTHTGKNPCICPVCKRSFSYFLHMNGHVTSYTLENSKICPMCRRNFAHLSNMKNNIMTHIAAKPEMNGLMKLPKQKKCMGKEPCHNMSKESTVENRVVIQRYSGKVGQENVKVYLVTHNMNRSIYQCTVCSKAFFSKSTSISHMRNY
uniref:Gastrula zinc finger protein XlCGF57.1-like n=1 Tax=Brugia timori TaxID=42155 RepID=A0A0R3R0U1_9BILA